MFINLLFAISQFLLFYYADGRIVCITNVNVFVFKIILRFYKMNKSTDILSILFSMFSFSRYADLYV